MQVVCCACKRVEGQNGWSEAPVASKGEVSYGYCPACFQLATQFLRQGRRKRSGQADSFGQR